MRNQFKKFQIIAVAGLVLFCLNAAGWAKKKKSASKDLLVNEDQEINLPSGNNYGISSESTLFKTPKRCLVCKRAGIKSVVKKNAVRESAKISNVFVDAEGKKHDHSYETVAEAFYCEKGHWWLEPQSKGSCWCGWNIDRKKSVLPVSQSSVEEEFLSEQQIHEIRKRIADGKSVDAETVNHLLQEIDELKASLKALKSLFDPGSPIWKK